MSKLGVIVLNYKDSENTIRICKAYERMKTVEKIIVVDNQSPDNSYQKLKNLESKKVDVIQTAENNGYSSGNNYGLKYLEEHYGNFDYIAISNPDIYIQEEAIKACKEYLDKHKNIAICAPKMLDKNGIEHPLSGWKLRSIRGDIWDSSILLTRIIKRPHIEMYDAKHMKKKIIPVDCVAGSFFIIRNSVFKEVGYFDEKTFLYYEEDILGNKIHKLGYKNVILNDYQFKHLESVSVDNSMKFMKKQMNLQKSKIYYHKTYNNCGVLKLSVMYFFTYFRYVEQFFINLPFAKVEETIFRLYKLFILLIAVLILPIQKLIRYIRPKQKILYYSVVNWRWIKQRPHFVPLYLCEHGYKVDYIYEEPYEKYKGETNLSPVDNDHELKELKIKTFKYFPYHLKRSRLNRFIFVMRCLFYNYDKIILTNPKQVSSFFMTVMKIKGTKFYYECMDNYIYWEPPYNINFFQGWEKYVVENVEKIIVSATGLKELLKKKYNCPEEKIILIRNGYDKNVFENYEPISFKMEHPNATYIGTIDEWFDFTSIIQYAKKNPKKHIYIIGPVGLSIKDKVASIKDKNIHFIGSIEHKYVPSAIENSDVMLLPFIVNSLIEDVDPVKIYEYLYMKKPVVSSYWKELDQFKEFVIFYKDRKDFNKALDSGFKQTVKINKNYQKLMKESTWDNRLKKYLDTIK